MLTVHTMANALVFVDLVQNPVCILHEINILFESVSYVLHGSSEYDNLINLTHFFEEYITSRSH